MRGGGDWVRLGAWLVWHNVKVRIAIGQRPARLSPRPAEGFLALALLLGAFRRQLFVACSFGVIYRARTCSRA